MPTLRMLAAWAALLALTPAAPTQTSTWTGAVSTNWNTAGNWNPAAVPNSATTTVNFDNTGIASGGSVVVSSSVQAVIFNFTNTTGSYTLTSTSGAALQGVASITIGSGVTGTETVNPASIEYGGDLGSNLTLTNNAAVGVNPTLVIGSATVITTPVNGGISVAGTGFTLISAAIGGVTSQDTRHGLTETGSGLLELTGNNTGLDGASNSNVSVTLSGGTLAINADAALGATGDILKLDANSATAGGLEFLNGGVTIARPVTLASATRLISNGTDSNTISGLISGAGQLIKDGTGKLILSNGSNSYSGGTAVNNGTLQVGAGGALPATGPVTLANAAGVTLDLNGFSQTVSSLAGGGSSGGNVLLGGGNLSTGGDNTSTAFAGSITGAGSLTKTGTGTLTLTGTGSSVAALAVTAGNLTFGGGTLTLTQSTGTALTVGAAGAMPGLTIQGGATLDASATNTVFVSGSAGTAVTVDGAGSTLKTGTQLVISGGGAPANNNGAIVVQNGGHLQAVTNLFVGAGGGLGTLTVQSGGTVVTPVGIIGFEAGQTGAATVTGPGSVWTNTQSLGLGGFSAGQQGGTGTLTIAAGGAVAVTGATTLWTAASSLTIDGGTLTTGSLGAGAGIAPDIFLTDPASGPALTTGGNNGSATFAGPIADTADGPGSVNKVGSGTLTLTGHLTNTGGYTATAGKIDFSGALIQPGPGSFIAVAGATIQYDTGTRVFGGFLYGPGTHVVTGGSTFTGSTSVNNAVINVTGAGSFVSFTNGGALSVTAGASTPANFNGFTNQGSGAITIGAGSATNAANFQSYGMLTLTPNTAAAPTILTNTGSSPLFFNGGSQTFIGTPATADPTGQNVVDYIDLHGNNAIVAGGLLVNNGGIFDTSAAGTSTIIAEFGALVKGAGFYQNTVKTQNGGKFQTGNSPGSATFGNFVFGPGGVSNYVFAIDDATGTAGPSPNASGLVSGWGLIKAVQVSLGAATSSGNFTWTATPSNPLTVAIDTLVNPTTVGTDLAGPMADFDPNQPYSWTAARWTGVYAGPTDAAMLDADTSFDTSGIVNPIAGTFGWSLDPSDQTLSLVYTPASVPEPGTLALVLAVLFPPAIRRGLRWGR